ncbi:MAG: hypothetical protein P4L35_01955 [Ignavibacteriaceae bacterium]|nr:hypothetical protein [Ignavibacteriaceae bacterium]
MDKKYGFNYQEHGNCGQYALLNALLLLGIPISVKDAHHITRVSRLKALWEGTEPEKIIRGIKKYGCRAEPFSSNDEQKLKVKVDAYLQANIPLIVCVDDYEHYAVLAGKINNKYYWIDSADSHIMGHSPWTDIRDWLESSEEDDCYYFIAVIPPKNNNVLNDIDKLLKISRKNEDLFNNYGYLLRDLLDVIGDQGSSGKRVLLAEFLARHRNKALSSIEELYYYTDTKELEQILRGYITIATLHNLTIAVENEIDVLARLTVMVTMYAVGIY